MIVGHRTILACVALPRRWASQEFANTYWNKIAIKASLGMGR
jgi:hypothetical protein